MKDRLSFISFERSISFLVFTIFITFFHFSESHSQPYLRYFENGKVGYIDTTGKVVIKARFAQAGDFSEGLAPARLEGLYGFIDVNGNYVIPPKYDFANSFKEGFAIVYVDSIPMYIDKKGNIPFITKHKRLFDFERGIAKVETYDSGFALINKRGNTIVSGAKKFSLIDSSGIYKVETLSKEYGSMVYVIDSTGKILIEPGRIKDIRPFCCGRAYVTYDRDTTLKGLSYYEKWAFVNTNFETVIKGKENIQPMGDYSEGLVPLLILYETRDTMRLDENFYCGYMDTSGNITISDTSYKVCSGFVNGNAYVISREQLFSIDKNGKLHKKYRSKELPKYKDRNGSLLIVKNHKYSIRDSADNELQGMIFDNAHLISGFSEFVLVFVKMNEDNKLKYGICNFRGEILLEPVLDYCYFFTSYKGLLRAIIDTRRCYVNSRGKIVWQEKEYFRFDTLNIDYINTDHHIGLVGGKIQELRFTPPDNKITIVVIDDDEYTYKQHPAKRVYLINNSKDKIRIDGRSGSRGIFLCQALNPRGEWVNIEKFYSKDEIIKDDYYLYPGYYYVSLHPSYKGGMKTKLRYMFYYISNTRSEDTGLYEIRKVYSDEFYGSINPGQLWRKVSTLFYKNDIERDFFGNY